MYDIAVIGAGINGCSIAYEFIRAGKSVLLLDKEGIASGGSGAAGAFISPKFSKSGELKTLLNAAFSYSMEYYKNNFPDAFTPSQLCHIAKDGTDDTMLREYKKTCEFILQSMPQEMYDALTQKAKQREYISLNAAIVNAQKVCTFMSKDTTFIEEKVENLSYKGDFWSINENYKAKKVILANGAYENIIKEPYINIRGIWGHRIDVKSTTQTSCSLHQFVSVSKSEEGILAIGATHNIHYHPEKNDAPYDLVKGREELLAKAAQTIALRDVKIIKDYMGLRSASVDYMPLVGGVIHSKETINSCGNRLQDKRIGYNAFSYYPHLYMINGSGGYGFVLAPYLAKILKEHILHDKVIDKSIAPARYFARWARRR